MLNILLFHLLGLITGIISGSLGLAGGIILIPALVLLFGFSQHQAQGTCLASLLPPLGILGVLVYYKQGYVNLNAAIFISTGLFLGTFLGAKIAVSLPEIILKKIFGVVLLVIALRIILLK